MLPLSFYQRGSTQPDSLLLEGRQKYPGRRPDSVGAGKTPEMLWDTGNSNQCCVLTKTCALKNLKASKRKRFSCINALFPPKRKKKLSGNDKTLAKGALQAVTSRHSIIDCTTNPWVTLKLLSAPRAPCASLMLCRHFLFYFPPYTVHYRFSKRQSRVGVCREMGGELLSFCVFTRPPRCVFTLGSVMTLFGWTLITARELMRRKSTT